CLLEVVDVAVKELLVGEHAQAGGAMALIADGNVGRQEGVAQQALAGAGLLDFRDHAGVAGVDLLAQGALEVAQVVLFAVTRLGLFPDGTQAASAQGGRHFLVFDVDDFLQDVGHGQSPRECWMNCCSLSAAKPLDSASRAAWTPSSSETTTSAAYKAAPALSKTMSRAAPGWLSSTQRMTSIDSSRLATFREASSCTPRPNCAGWMRYSRTAPSLSSATRVSPDTVASSRPSLPCTISTCLEPRRWSTRAKMPTRSGWKTPMSWLGAPAGLVKGPRMLKSVRTPSSLRTGAACFMAPWCLGANMKPTPVAFKQAATCSGAKSMLAPSASSTSALPVLEDTLRPPCLATRAPAAA